METRVVYYNGVPYKFITGGERMGCVSCCFTKNCHSNVSARIDPHGSFTLCISLSKTPYYHFEEIPIAMLLKEIKDENTHNK